MKSKTAINKFTFWMNIAIDIFFAIVIVTFALIEIYCWSSDLSEPPLSMFFDTSEARFYINNLIIIICPLIDSIIGIAFSAYNDKIYGFTISDLKRLSKYSGFSFFEIICISIISIVLGILFYYLDLFYTALVLNIIVLLYTIIFVVTDVSLLARSRWRVFGIFKQRYKQCKKQVDKKYLVRLMPAFMTWINTFIKDKYKSGDTSFIENFGDIVKKFCLQDHGNIPKYEELFYRKLLRKRNNYNKDSYLYFIVSFSDTIESIVLDTFTDKKTNFSFSEKRKSDLCKVLLEFIVFVDKEINGDNAYTVGPLSQYYSVFIKSSFDFFDIYEFSDFDLDNQIFIANMMIHDGIDFTINYLKIHTEHELTLCLEFQDFLLSDILSNNLSSQVSYLYSAENNLLSCVDTRYFTNDLISNTAQEYPYFLSRSISDSIIDLKHSYDRFGDECESESSFSLIKLINTSLPYRAVSDTDFLSVVDKKYQKYHFLVSSQLLISSLMEKTTWVYENLNYLYKYENNISQDLDINFYIFSTIYLYNVYQQKNTSDDLRNKIDEKVKKLMSLHLDSCLFKNKEYQKAQSLSDLLLSIVNIFVECRDIQNWYPDFEIYFESELTPKFDGSLLITWWLSFACFLGFEYSKDCFGKLKDELNKICVYNRKFNKSDSYWNIFVDAFYEYYNTITSSDKNKIDEIFGYFIYFNQEFDDHNVGCALNAFKQEVTSATKIDLLKVSAPSSDIDEKVTCTQRIITNNIKHFKLYDKVSTCSKKHTFNKKFSHIVYCDNLNSSFADKDYCTNYQNEIINLIFKEIEQDATINSLGNVKSIKNYGKSELDYLKSRNFDEKYINISVGNEKSLQDVIKSLNAKTEFQGFFMPDYDLFYKKDAIKVQLCVDNQFHYNNISRQMAIRFIDQNYKGYLKNGLYYLPIPKAKNSNVCLELTREEFICLVMNQCVKLEFNTKCVVSINPKDIVIYKR